MIYNSQYIVQWGKIHMKVQSVQVNTENELFSCNI